MRQRAQNFPIIGSHAVFELLSDPAKYADVKEKLKFKKRKKNQCEGNANQSSKKLHRKAHIC